MSVSDLCNAPGVGTFVRSADMGEAVFRSGFDPFSLGLAHDFARMFGTGSSYTT